MRILIVRLSALGDLVHTLPMVSALRRAYPSAEIHWAVDERFVEMVDMVPVVDKTIKFHRTGIGSWLGAWRLLRRLRYYRYDIAVDAQGLLKSALIARLSGASRVVGFDELSLREPIAEWFYTEVVSVSNISHVVDKNLALTAHLGLHGNDWDFPLGMVDSTALIQTRLNLGLESGTDFALLNPGTAWGSKCWEPKRFGELAQCLWERLHLRSVVTWGPGEEELAHEVVNTSKGAAVMAAPTGISDLVMHVRAAAVVVAGDTGPLHLAAAVGAPVVGIYGPSDPGRNGPWSAEDGILSMFSACQCRADRELTGSKGVVIRFCQRPKRCLDDLSVQDVFEAVERRLSRRVNHG